MNKQNSRNNSFPAVATIIGCPEELVGADGLVATPLVMEDHSAAQMDDSNDNLAMDIISEDTSQIKDPIQKALIDNILGNVPTKHPQDKFKCELCNVEVPTMSTLRLHLNGAKHNKKVKEESLDKEADSPHITYIEEKKIFVCSLCNTTLNARVQIKMHLNGNKHKQKLEMEGKTDEKREESDKPKVDATLNLRYCATCGIHVNSENQLQQHIRSQKHINRVNGVAPPIRGGMRGRGKWTPSLRGRSAPYPANSHQAMKNTPIGPKKPMFQPSRLPYTAHRGSPQPLMSSRTQYHLPSVSYRSDPELSPIFYRGEGQSYMDGEYGNMGSYPLGYNSPQYNRRQPSSLYRENSYVSAESY